MMKIAKEILCSRYSLAGALAAAMLFLSEAGTSEALGPSRPIPQHKFESAAKKPLWLRLLHVKPDVLGKWRSQNVRSTFLFAPAGSSPLAELEASHEAFAAGRQHSNGLISQPAVCAFPARRRFLEAELGIRYPEPEPCQAYETWREGLAAKDVSLIFSTYFVTNPASMFGHVFLRLDQSTKEAEVDSLAAEASVLLSYAVSYAAHVTTDNPILYGYWGLTGGFSGYYYIDPFYIKAKEYGFGENRDLFEYRLNFSEEETSRLVAHLWELYGQAAFTYYFFDANCATYIAQLLEVAKPEWDLNATEFFYDLPSEALKRIIRNAGATSVVQRLSLRHELMQKLQRLSVAERRQLYDAVGEPIAGIEAVELSAEVLDVWIYLEQLRAYRSDGANSERLKLLDALRKKRLKLAASSLPERGIDYHAEKESPHLGHPPFRLGLFSEMIRRQAPGFGLTVRPGFHEFDDPVSGYPLTQSVSYMKAEFYQNAKRKVPELRQLTLLDVMATPPFIKLDPQLSWQFAAKVWQGEGETTTKDPIVDMSGSLGLSMPLATAKWQLLTFATAQLQYGRYALEGARQHWQPGLKLLARGAVFNHMTVSVAQDIYWHYEPAVPGKNCRSSTIQISGGPDQSWRLAGTGFYKTCGLSQLIEQGISPLTLMPSRDILGVLMEYAWYL